MAQPRATSTTVAAQQPPNGRHNGIAHGHGHGQEYALFSHVVPSSSNTSSRITLRPTITPLLPVRQPINGNGYGVPEGGPNNGFVYVRCASPYLVLTLRKGGLTQANESPFQGPSSRATTPWLRKVTSAGISPHRKDSAFCVG